MVLQLDLDQQIASGMQRTIFHHPTDPTKLVKVMRLAEDMPHRKGLNAKLEKMFPALRQRNIRKEYQEYLRLMLDNPQAGFRAPMAHILGFVTTNIGLGCLTEKVTGENGELGETLSNVVKNGRFDARHLTALNDTIARFYLYSIRASDLNGANLVFGYRCQLGEGRETAGFECVVIDGLGDIHAIQIRRMARWSNRLGLDDSFRRLARKNRLVWDQSKRQMVGLV